MMINSKKNIDVVLLCGGKGQRLRPLTVNTPKPLLLVNKKPFLYYMIRKFLKLKVNQIILATGYKSQKVSLFVNKFFKKNKNIILVNSGNVDIIKRLKDCSKYIKNDFSCLFRLDNKVVTPLKNDSVILGKNGFAIFSAIIKRYFLEESIVSPIH